MGRTSRSPRRSVRELISEAWGNRPGLFLFLFHFFFRTSGYPVDRRIFIHEDDSIRCGGACHSRHCDHVGLCSGRRSGRSGRRTSPGRRSGRRLRRRTSGRLRRDVRHGTGCHPRQRAGQGAHGGAQADDRAGHGNLRGSAGAPRAGPATDAGNASERRRRLRRRSGGDAGDVPADAGEAQVGGRQGVQGDRGAPHRRAEGCLARGQDEVGDLSEGRSADRTGRGAQPYPRSDEGARRVREESPGPGPPAVSVAADAAAATKPPRSNEKSPPCQPGAGGFSVCYRVSTCDSSALCTASGTLER